MYPFKIFDPSSPSSEFHLGHIVLCFPDQLFKISLATSSWTMSYSPFFKGKILSSFPISSSFSRRQTSLLSLLFPDVGDALLFLTTVSLLFLVTYENEERDREVLVTPHNLEKKGPLAPFSLPVFRSSSDPGSS